MHVKTEYSWGEKCEIENSIYDYLEECSNNGDSESSYIILYKGKRVTLSNGKSVWKKISHAKAALRIKIENLIIRYNHYELTETTKNFPRQYIKEYITDTMNYLIDSKTIEIVEIK